MARSDHPYFQVINWREAETILGYKVNRRYKYFKHTQKGISADWLTEYKVFTYSEWTEECSGCSEYIDGHKIYDACGCSECGYTGKRRDGMHAPYFIDKD